MTSFNVKGLQCVYLEEFYYMFYMSPVDKNLPSIFVIPILNRV